MEMMYNMQDAVADLDEKKHTEPNYIMIYE